jgi:hypothetical protein
MNDYIFFMHNDAKPGAAANSDAAWEAYFIMLQQSGRFAGGSSIGSGECVRADGQAKAVSEHLVGYIRVQADSIEEAKLLLVGNPILDAGGTIEVRALPPG